MSGEPRYMLALVQEPSGAFRPLHGRIEVRGGKVEKIEIPELQRAAWLELLNACRVEFEARYGIGLKPIAAPMQEEREEAQSEG